MGLLELLAQAVPNQQSSLGLNPLAAALQTLLVGAPPQAAAQPAAAPKPDGGLVGGLGGLLQKLQDAWPSGPVKEEPWAKAADRA